MKDKQFLWLQGDLSDGSFDFQLINFDQIVTVDLDAGRVRLRLAGGVTVNVGGAARYEVLKLCFRHSVMVDGEQPPAELLKIVVDAIDVSRAKDAAESVEPSALPDSPGKYPFTK